MAAVIIDQLVVILAVNLMKSAQTAFAAHLVKQILMAFAVIIMKAAPALEESKRSMALAVRSILSVMALAVHLIKLA